MRTLLLFVAAAAVLAAQNPLEPGLYATINTSRGVIVARLFEKETPNTVRNFVNLARGAQSWVDPKTRQPVKRPFFNGITIHRVIPDFMIQMGDPTGTGRYSAGYTIKDEFVPTLKFDVAGRLAMANAGPNTGSCQFFITTVPTPHLNGKHAIFGQVVEGMDVVKDIEAAPRMGEKPMPPIRILTVTIKREGEAPAAGAGKKAG